MEDVVLHYQPGSADGLGSLLERTQKLLEPFPCRPPPVFTPWFPAAAAAGRNLPIRPAKPPPIITASDQILSSDSRPHAHTAAEAVTEPLTEIKLQKPKVDNCLAERRHGRPHAEAPGDGVCVSENVPPASLFNRPDGEAVTRPSPDKHRDGVSVTDSPVKRSWSVSAQKSVPLQSSQSLSKRFRHMVSVHSLHLRQRVRWVIGQHNCGEAKDIEQVWRALNRFVRSSRLPTCNANIQRERAEIWVFCDVLCSEQVGRFLKDELRLSGRISLAVHRLGDVFSM